MCTRVSFLLTLDPCPVILCDVQSSDGGGGGEKEEEVDIFETVPTNVRDRSPRSRQKVPLPWPAAAAAQKVGEKTKRLYCSMQLLQSE